MSQLRHWMTRNHGAGRLSH